MCIIPNIIDNDVETTFGLVELPNQLTIEYLDFEELKVRYPNRVKLCCSMFGNEFKQKAIEVNISFIINGINSVKKKFDDVDTLSLNELLFSFIAMMKKNINPIIEHIKNNTCSDEDFIIFTVSFIHILSACYHIMPDRQFFQVV